MTTLTGNSRAVCFLELVHEFLTVQIGDRLPGLYTTGCSPAILRSTAPAIKAKFEFFRLCFTEINLNEYRNNTLKLNPVSFDFTYE